MLMIYLANVGYTVSCQGIVQLGGPVPWCNRVGPAKVWLVSLLYSLPYFPLKLDYLVTLRLLKIFPSIWTI